MLVLVIVNLKGNEGIGWACCKRLCMSANLTVV